MVRKVDLVCGKCLPFFEGESGRPAARRQVVDSQSRDREILRSVFKGLVSSGRKHSSPSPSVQSTPAGLNDGGLHHPKCLSELQTTATIVWKSREPLFRLISFSVAAASLLRLTHNICMTFIKRHFLNRQTAELKRSRQLARQHNRKMC